MEQATSKIKMFRFNTGMCLICEVLSVGPQLQVRAPMAFVAQMSNTGQMNLTFQPLTEFGKDPLGVLGMNASLILFELDPNPQIETAYIDTVQRMRAAQSGIVLPGAGQPGAKLGVVN